jgi:hypothetical protein
MLPTSPKIYREASLGTCRSQIRDRPDGRLESTEVGWADSADDWADKLRPLQWLFVRRPYLTPIVHCLERIDRRGSGLPEINLRSESLRCYP